MYFEQSGNGESVVVYLHGWGCDGSIFAPIVKRLPNCKNYVVDFVGFGRSEEPPESGLSVGDYAEQLYQFLQEQDLPYVTLVGHSFGCRVAIVLAATHPELVERMLLVAPAALRRFSLKRWWRVQMYKLNKFLAKLGLVQISQSYGSDDYRNCSSAMRKTFVKVVNQDLSSYAKRVRCPVIIVNGTSDTATPITHARRLNRLLPDSHLIEIDGDHYAFFYTPKAFADTIQNFVR